MSTSSGSGRSQSSKSTGTKKSDNALSARSNPALGEVAWLIEIQLTNDPRTTNLDRIRRLIDIYGTKSKYLQDSWPSLDQEGMAELGAACSYQEVPDQRYRSSMRALYRLKEEQRRQLQEHISRLQGRKTKLEEALAYSRHPEMFRAKMEPLINDYSKFSL